MASCPTQLIQSLQSKPVPSGTEDIWYCIAACSMACSNAGPWVPHVYTLASASKPAPERRRILKRMLESLLETSLLYGIPRMLNAFYPLAAEAAKDTEMLDLEGGKPVLDLRQGEEFKNPLDLTDRGLDYFRNIYRDDMERILAPMDRIAPDIRQYSVHIEYGSYMSEVSILSPVETSMVTIAGLLPLDVPTQVKWHMRGLIRVGGSEEQVLYALNLAKEVVKAAEVVLRNEVPGVDVLYQEKLFG